MRETISPLPHDSIVPSSLQPPLEGEPSIMAGKTSFVSAVFAAIMEGPPHTLSISPPFPWGDAIVSDQENFSLRRA